MTNKEATSLEAPAKAKPPRRRSSGRGGSSRGDTRERLLAAARKLFVERGFHATRPQDISREAGVGHGTFYLHFSDKRACFLAFAESAAAELDAYLGLGIAIDSDPETGIRQIIERSYHFSIEHPGLLLAAMTDMRIIDGESESGSVLMAHWGDTWTRVFSEWRDRGLIDSERVDVDVIGNTMASMIRAAGEFASRQVEDESQVEAALGRATDALVRFVSAGLGLKTSDKKDTGEKTAPGNG